MSTRRQQIKKSDFNVIRATFEAIADAEGWDRAFPKSLANCVMARLSLESQDTMQHFANQLRQEMRPESMRIADEDASGGA